MFLKLLSFKNKLVVLTKNLKSKDKLSFKNNSY